MRNPEAVFQNQPHQPHRPSPVRKRRALPPRALPGCSTAAPDLGHSQVVHDSWRKHFRGLAVGTRLLDIASGIGAVALIAREISHVRRRRFEVHSLDQTSTLDALPLELDGIHFHARRYDRTTPFEDGYFDAISVQWAFPEGDNAAAGLAELRRILRRGGRARFMFHAVGGASHAECLGRVRAVDTLLDEVRLLEHARRMFETSYSLMAAPKHEVLHHAMLAIQSQQEYLNTCLLARHLMRATPNPQGSEQVLQLIADCWERRSHMSLAEIGAQLDRVESDLRAVQARLRAACALAVDEMCMHRIGKAFKAAGFRKVTIKPFKSSDDSLIGWDLQAG
ncbi:MAG TPA: methyltransferase domain-containing protein [Gammaproteobacteria bacterium]|jgi:SAM-dependent methyltransferase